jgi:hypothetical protein
VITANVPSRDRWLTPHPTAYQASTGAWSIARSDSSVSISNRPAAESRPSAESVKPKTKKGKEKQTRSSLSPPPEPAAQATHDSQAKGPLGAPLLSTDEPQILEAEAEEEDLSLTSEEPTPDADSPGAEESRQWDRIPPAQSAGGPQYGVNEDNEEFRNVWDSGR